MKKIMGHCLGGALALLGGLALAVGAELPATDQEALRKQYVNKVLIFRKSYRMLDRLEVKADGTVAGKPRPGYWTMDGACQVKDLEFRKDAVILKCTKLGANVKDDGQLHYFPVSAALKGKTDYPEKMDVVFRTASAGKFLAQVNEQVSKIFLSEQEPKLAATPAPISAYIQKLSIQPDIDPAPGAGFDGTLPKLVSTLVPDLSREA